MGYEAYEVRKSELLLNTICPYNTNGELSREYDLIHLLRSNNKFIGALGIVQESSNTMSVDIWFKEGRTDINFIRWCMEVHKGWHCLITCLQGNLAARILFRRLGFKKVKESELLFLYELTL